MPSVREWLIPASRVRSLAWAGDTLIDFAAGGVRFELDGSTTPASMYWGFPFDGVATAPGSDYAVLYARLGTKGVLLKNGATVRELNRSSYQASAYLYPICLVQRGGRTLLIHCPERYNKLEIEDAETGERLTSRASQADDFFHSRLTPNASGTRFFSAGWVWHPWDAVAWFDIDEAHHDPKHLDTIGWCAPHSRNVGLAEESSACWQSDVRTIVSGSEEEEDPEELAEAGDEPFLRQRGLAVFDTNARKILSSVVLAQPTGEMMAIGDTHVVAFLQHPRLIRLADGAVEHEWPELATGGQRCSITHGTEPMPPLALDPLRRRFAVALASGIHVVEVDVGT